MTKEELAAKLNGRQYAKEMTDLESKQAEKDGLLVVYGASDDLCELRGIIDDEEDAYNGTEVLIGSGCALVHELQDSDRDEISCLERYGVLEYVRERQKKVVVIKAEWCKTEGYSWTITTSIPHATFDVMEDEDKFCRGIVVSRADIEEALEKLGAQASA